MTESASSGPNKTVRIALFACLAVALVLLAFEWTARTKASSAYDKLQSGDLETVGTTPGRVHQLLNRKPDAPGKEKDGDLVESFTWQGFRKHVVYVAYAPVIGEGGKPSFTLDRITLNEAP